MEFWRLVKNFVEGENKGESKETHGGGMKKCKKRQREKRIHFERCAKSDQRRIKIITKEREIKQEKLSVEQ